VVSAPRRAIRRLLPRVGGPLAVLVAAFIVKELPILYMRWLVVVVVVYTASSMIAAATKSRAAMPAARPVATPIDD